MDLRRLPSLAGAALAGAAALLLAAAPAAAGEQTSGWGWPLAPRPAVAAPFTAPPGPYAPGHRGVDLAAPAGSLVLAASAGIVAFAGRVAGRGVVSVDHPGGLRSTYQPVTARLSRGDRIIRGAVLGVLEAGPSHCLPASCLHWGVRRGTTYLDPLSLLGAVRVRLLPVWVLDRPPAAALPPSGVSPPASGVRSRATGRPPVTAATAAVAAGAAVLLGAGLMFRRRGPPRPAHRGRAAQSRLGRSAASRK